MSDIPTTPTAPSSSGPDFRVTLEPAHFQLTGLSGSFGVADIRAAPPGLMLQSVVTLGERTNDGHVIEAVSVYWFEIIKLISKDPRALDQIDWRKMEEIIAGAYKAAGFDEVILTDRSGDHGRDLIATSKAYGFSIRIIDQVKKYTPGHAVTANDVRALLGVLLTDHSVTKGIVTTTSTFAPGIITDPFIAPHIPNRLELRSGTELMTWLTDVAENTGKLP
jgi:restriction system protein